MMSSQSYGYQDEEDPLEDAGEVVKQADDSCSILEPTPFSDCERIGGARRYIDVSSTALDGEGKRARHKIGSAV